MIKIKAQVVAESLSLRDFKASGGWVSKFCKRNRLVRRCITSQGQKIPANASKIAEKFIKDISALTAGHSLNNILNMDEVPVYFDMPTKHTLESMGQKTIQTKTTGHEKTRFTVALTCTAAGRKLKPFIIFKGLKNIPKQDFPEGMVKAYNLMFT